MINIAQLHRASLDATRVIGTEVAVPADADPQTRLWPCSAGRRPVPSFLPTLPQREEPERGSEGRPD